MANTPNLNLPLVASAQAQKHITVNESLTLIDAVLRGDLSGWNEDTPPVAPISGEVFLLGSSPSGDWSGQDGKLAYFTDGGWRFLTPQAGWGFFDPAEKARVTFDGTSWAKDTPRIHEAGAETRLEIAVTEHAVQAGPDNVTAVLIPSHAHVFAVTAKVSSEVTGTGGSWKLGVAGAEDRYGSGIGFADGSLSKGVTGTGVTYYADTPLVLTCEGGDFAAGSVKLAIHYLSVSEPE